MNDKLPHLTAKDLDLILGVYDQQASEYRTNKANGDPEEVAYADKMLKKIDDMARRVIFRYYNQETIK